MPISYFGSGSCGELRSSAFLNHWSPAELVRHDDARLIVDCSWLARRARFRSVSAGSTSPALSAHAINSRQLRGVGNQTSGRVSPLSLLEFVRRKSDARVHFNFVQRPPLWVGRPYTRRGQGHEPDSLFYVSPYHQAAHKNLLPYRMSTGWQVNVKLWKTMLRRSLIKFVSTRFMQQMTVVLALRRAFVVWQIERRPIPLQYSCQFRAPSSFTYHSALLLTPIALSKVPWRLMQPGCD